MHIQDNSVIAECFEVEPHLKKGGKGKKKDNFDPNKCCPRRCCGCPMESEEINEKMKKANESTIILLTMFFWF